MSELLAIAPVVIVAFVLGILIGMGIQVRSEQRWIKQSGRSVITRRRSTPQIDSDGSCPRVRNGSPKTDRPESS
jgi:hypothetical protein